MAVMPPDDDVEEEIRRVGAVREITHFIDHDRGDVWTSAGVGELACSKRGR